MSDIELEAKPELEEEIYKAALQKELLRVKLEEDELLKAKLQAVASGINKSLKYDLVVVKAEDSGSHISRWIPTKSVLLNLLLGEANYGVPVGRMFEVFGEFSHGKSTIVQLMMAAFQQNGGISVLADAESTWVEEYALKHGHDPTKHIFIEADTVEAGFSGIKEVSRQFINVFGGSVPVLFDWDTIAASPTEKEAADETDRMAAKAGVIRRELRVLSRLLPKVPASVAFVNQTIDQLGGQHKSKTTPGGSGIKFWATFRLKVEKVAPIHNDVKRVVGFVAKVTAVKNKLGPPGRSVDIPILYESGVDSIREVLNYHLDNTNVVNIAGAYKKVDNFPEPGKYISFYDRDMYTIAEQYPTLYDYLSEKAKQHWLGIL